MMKLVRDQVMSKEIKAIGICDLLDVLYPGYWSESLWQKYTYEETSAAILNWCKENNWFLYERPDTDFFEYEAYNLAREAGAVGIVFSNLS